MYRKSKIKDCKNIYNLVCEMENKQLPYTNFQEIYFEQLQDENYYCLVCELDDKVIGMLNLRFEKQLHHAEKIAEIMEFSIASGYRNKGIGKEMFEQACLIAENNNCNQIEVACNQLRKDTHRFYLREGMHNFHYKFSKRFDDGDVLIENKLGR